MRQDIIGLVNHHVIGSGNPTGHVRRSGIDDHDLVQQRVAHHQFRPHDDDPLGNGFFLVQGGQAQGDGHILPLFGFDQGLEVLKFGMVKRV
jgi:hypothetical protein